MYYFAIKDTRTGKLVTAFVNHNCYTIGNKRFGHFEAVTDDGCPALLFRQEETALTWIANLKVQDQTHFVIVPLAEMHKTR